MTAAGRAIHFEHSVLNELDVIRPVQLNHGQSERFNDQSVT